MDPITEDNSWEPCSDGEIKSLVTSVRSSKQRTKTLRSVTLFATITSVALLCSLAFINPDQPKPNGKQIGGLSCAEVLAQAEQYQNGTVSDELKEQIHLHLAHCKYCERKYNQLSQELSKITRNSELIAFLGKLETDHHHHH